MPVAERVTEARERAGLTKRELARRAGVSQETIWRAELGEGVSRGTLALIALALGLPGDHFDGEEAIA